MAKRKEAAGVEPAPIENPAPGNLELFVSAPAPKIELPKAPILPAPEPVAADVSEPVAEVAPQQPDVAPALASIGTVVAAKKISLRRRNRLALLAACITLAAGIGSIMGAVIGVTLARVRAEAPIPAQRINDTTTETLRQLRADMSALKASVETGNKSASAQFITLADRLEKSEKAQSEPAAKIARIAEAIDRLDKKAGGADVTGSIVEKQQTRPALVDGWVLRDIYRGRALLENRAGLFEVGPGSNLPGVGRIETIKRQDGRWVVVTPKGLIVSGR